MRRTVITGAGGWVGRCALDAARPYVGASLVGCASTRRVIPSPSGPLRAVTVDDLLSFPRMPGSRIIHRGFPTQDQVGVVGDAAYGEAVGHLRRTMVALLEKSCDLEVVYLSSGAASRVEYGLDVPHRTRVYGQAKLDDEAAYREAIASTGGRLCIVRAFALSGPYMTKPATYALGNMILQALDHGAIEVRATRPVRRSYMAIDDMLQIAMHAVGRLGPGESITFETAGEVVEMDELAACVLGVLGCDLRSVTRPLLDPDAPPDDYLGDPVVVGCLAAAAGVTPAGLDEQIAVTAAWLRDEGGL